MTSECFGNKRKLEETKKKKRKNQNKTTKRREKQTLKRRKRRKNATTEKETTVDSVEAGNEITKEIEYIQLAERGDCTEENQMVDGLLEMSLPAHLNAQDQSDQSRVAQDAEGQNPSDPLLALLKGLKLENLLEHLQEEEIDVEALCCMTPQDFEELGIKMGPRVKIKHTLSTCLPKLINSNE